MTSSFRKRLLVYLAATQQPAETFAIQILGTGIATLIDDLGAGNNVSIYFDAFLWELRLPDLWKDTPYPPTLREKGMGVLPRQGRNPCVVVWDDANAFAHEHLQPVRGATWWQLSSPRCLVQPEDCLTES